MASARPEAYFLQVLLWIMFTAKQDGNNKKQDMIHDSPALFYIDT